MEIVLPMTNAEITSNRKCERPPVGIQYFTFIVALRSDWTDLVRYIYIDFFCEGTLFHRSRACHRIDLGVVGSVRRRSAFLDEIVHPRCI